MNEIFVGRFNIRLACTALDRMFGLLRKDLCRDGEALLIAPCNSIHSFGMKEPIDIAFVDKRGEVLKSVLGFKPGKLSSCSDAACVLERRSNTQNNDDEWPKPGQCISLLIDRSRST